MSIYDEDYLKYPDPPEPEEPTPSGALIIDGTLIATYYRDDISEEN